MNGIKSSFDWKEKEKVVKEIDVQVAEELCV